MVKNKNCENAGFTLIELLVVISIIGLLASVVLVSLNSARVKARDAKRINDLKQIRTALELYYSDNGHYPITVCSANTWAAFDPGTFYASNGTCATAGAAPNSPNITATLAPYMKAGAKDPKRYGNGYVDDGYLYYSPDGVDFKLMAWRTPENMNDFDSSVIDNGRCGSIVNGQCSNVVSNTVGFWTAGGVNY